MTTNTAPWLAIATDKGMYGWGKARGFASFVVYECRDEHERKLAFEYLESRPEMKHVRTSYEQCAGDYSPRDAYVSRYDAGKVPSVRFYREALEAEKARRAGIDAGILSGSVVSVSDVIYGASWGTSYEVLTYDEESDEMRVKSSHSTLRESKRAARRLARSLGVPCRESGRTPMVWTPKLRCWVPC